MAYEAAERYTPEFVERSGGWLLNQADRFTPGNLHGARDAAVDYLTYDLPTPESVYVEEGVAGEASAEALKGAASVDVEAAAAANLGTNIDINTGARTAYYEVSGNAGAHAQALGIGSDGVNAGGNVVLALTQDANGRPLAAELTVEHNINDKLVVNKVHIELEDVEAGDAVREIIESGGNPAQVGDAIDNLVESAHVAVTTSREQYEVKAEDYGAQVGGFFADSGISVTVESAQRSD
jgi:hypothetical protein